MMGLGSEHTLALPLWTSNKPCELFNAVVNEENDCFVNCLHGVLSWEASLNGCLGHGHGHNSHVQHISRTSCVSPLFSVPSSLSRMSRHIKLLPGSCIQPASMVHSLLLISISIARISCHRKSR
ncbi:hypothetical protein CY35_01G102100 [Sphagnum magellanicum]|nr:hypothetical protein CY35_01G102100 [Sphagnum magellanicum]